MNLMDLAPTPTWGLVITTSAGEVIVPASILRPLWEVSWWINVPTSILYERLAGELMYPLLSLMRWLAGKLDECTYFYP